VVALVQEAVAAAKGGGDKKAVVEVAGVVQESAAVSGCAHFSRTPFKVVRNV